MHSARSKTPRSKSRSPIPPPRQAHSRPYLPPSHYAAAAGLTYPISPRQRPDGDTSPRPEGTSTPKQRRLSLGSIAYPSNRVSSLDFDSFSMSPGGEPIHVEPTATSPLSAKRQSALGNIPLLETHLLPSLKDTINRMTKPPPCMSPATLELPFPAGRQKCSSVYSVSSSVSNSSEPRSPTPRPNTLHRKTLAVPCPEAMVLQDKENSTKQRQRPALKSALRSPTPRVQTPLLDVPPRPMSALSDVSSKLAKADSISLRRKSISAGTKRQTSMQAGSGTTPCARPPPKMPNESNNSRTGRVRSRTDPGSTRKYDKAPLPFTPTPQPNSAMFSYPFTPQGKTDIHHDEETGESELEYHFEMDARQKRRLIVTNANVVPSSSESEVEKRTRLPMLVDQWKVGKSAKRDVVGLGLGFENGRKGSLRPVVTNPPREKSQAQSGTNTSESTPRPTPSMDMLHDLHRKRREALLGIVSGLELGLETRSGDTQSCDESDSCIVQEGLAISGSGDIGLGGKGGDDKREDVSEDGSVYMVEDDGDGDGEYGFVEVEEYDEGGEGRPDDQAHSTSTSVERSEDLRGRCMDTPRHFSDIQGLSDGAAHSSKDRKSPSRSPVIRNSTHVSIPAALRQYSVYEHQPLQNTHCENNADVDPERTSIAHDSDTLSLSEISYAASVREKKAFGIPPSESEEVFQIGVEQDWKMSLPRAESDLSSVGSSLWHEDCDELSMGAEALFKSLGRKNDRKSAQQGGTVSPQMHTDGFAAPHLSPISQSSSLSSSVYDDHLDPPQPAKISTATSGTWRSSLSPSTYDTLCAQYGDTEIKRQEVIWELCETEAEFVNRLHIMVKLFILPLRVQNTKAWITGVPSDVARFFDWLEDIVVLHNQILVVLQTCRTEQSPVVMRVADSLRRFVGRLEVYQPYMVKLEAMMARIGRLAESHESDFGEFVRIQQDSPDCQSWVLAKYLEEPKRRLIAYQTFFQELRALTPKHHEDFLPTFSLFHSADVVIHVIHEVKLREDEYDLVKSILARIQGLPSAVQLARRERRLLVHGLIQCTETDETCYRDDSVPNLGQDKSPLTERTGGTERSSRLLDAINEWNVHRGRSGSVKSVASTATGISFRSHTTSPSTLHLPVAPRVFRSDDTPSSNTTFASSCLGQSGFSGGPHLDTLSRATQVDGAWTVHAFVFTDLIVLTTPVHSRDEDPAWRLLDGIGLSRVLGVTLSPTSVHHTLLDLLPVHAESLDTGVIPSGSRTKTLRISLPDDLFCSRARQDHAKTRESTWEQWLSAFERCYHFTLRSLSSPSPSGGSHHHAHHGPHLDSDLNTQQSVLSMLAYGLPLPKSPSIQLVDLANGPAGDPGQLEREERGWWSLRFQQVLREVQRGQELHTIMF